MAVGTQTALKGVTERIAGRRASRMQALAVAVGAAVVAYRLLRSGEEEAETQDA
jgi:hypothetical protein